jgi:L-aminopeptidase/D-esterase-like protein
MFSYFKVGHFSDLENGTGCTVIIPPEDTVVSAAVQGASPGSRELALLSPDKKITHINALLLSGGSAFGLGAANGLMEYLAQNNIGYQTNYGVVPIVPAAVIFDLNIGNAEKYPQGQDAVTALKESSFNNLSCGNIGAGCGATVGKWHGMADAMKGGLGTASTVHGDFKCSVLSVVNAVGDVLDKKGNIVAGAIDSNKQFIAQNNMRKRWGKPVVGLADNTILIAVMINADFNKSQIHYLSQRAHYGIAKCVVPSHTSYDGDTIFVLSKRDVDIDIDVAAMIIIDTIQESIINGVKNTSELFGFKSVGNL